MSSAFDSDNTTGSAWLGASMRNPSKRIKPNAWKIREDQSNSFLAGNSAAELSKAQRSSKPAAQQHSRRKAATKTHKPRQQKPARLVSQPNHKSALQEFSTATQQIIAAVQEGIAEAAAENKHLNHERNENSTRLEKYAHAENISSESFTGMQNFMRTDNSTNKGKQPTQPALQTKRLQSTQKQQAEKRDDAAKSNSAGSRNDTLNKLFWIILAIFIISYFA